MDELRRASHEGLRGPIKGVGDCRLRLAHVVLPQSDELFTISEVPKDEAPPEGPGKTVPRAVS